MIHFRHHSLPLLFLLGLLCLLSAINVHAADPDAPDHVTMEGGEADLQSADLTDQMGLDEDGAPEDLYLDEDEENENEDEEEEDDTPPDSPAVIDPPGKENASAYKAPSARAASFFDDFQNGLSKWTHTEYPMYGGRFVVGQGASPTFPGDRALIIPHKAHHYGISAPISGLEDLSAKDLVFQYEVKLEQGMTCGGAYIKLPNADFGGPGTLDGATPYSVMFGPDKCGATDKVHVIIQTKNPVTEMYTEHHLKQAPSVANTFDKKTHLYTLIITADGKVTVMVDAEVKSEGTLSGSFDPPVQPEKEIDDPSAKKPSDWVDTEKIPDPDATKPDDWDEEAPRQIVDDDAEKPEGWLDDEPDKIPDPSQSKPEEWDTDEDGEWEPPLVDNPKCDEVGCGEWAAPMKDNPDYKGKWTAPRIANPKFIGAWKPPKVPNPSYYDVGKITLLPIHGIGVEVWTMDQGVLFDNIWIGSDADAAKEFAEATFVQKQITELKNEEEASKKEKSESSSSKLPSSLGPVMDKVEDYIEKLEVALKPLEDFLVDNGAEPLLDKLLDAGVAKPMYVVISIPLIITLFFLSCIGGKKKPSPEVQAAAEEAMKKKTDEPTPDDNAEESEATPAEDDQEKSTARRRRGRTAGTE